MSDDDIEPGVEVADTDIAVVGMAGRFPGAPDPDALWRRVVAGDDCLTDLTRAELIAAGVPPHLADDPAYVARTGLLDDVERFDANFFGIGARDASVMDPQHRHFLECAWSALESAAMVPSRFDGSIGVFAGSGMNTYLINNLLSAPGLLAEMGWFLLRHTGNDKDFLATEVSYRLDLRGPSVNVQTACSTSLVAVHLAAQSLLGFECDAAIAGGVTIEVPQRTGHLHQVGEVLSADGRCRAFDAASTGTVLTSGVGAVVLRRLADALDDGDPVLAVIKGSAVNNDGARKVSYLAPSVDGHAEVVREALAVAGIDPADIQLIETHGTGTALGDPIEFAALSEAFAGVPAGVCRLGSTKPNVGHLDTAAGVASLIKVIQALRHKVLPPMANHTAPSELISWAGSPFALSASSAPWPGNAVRRAGVSSLGVGGTNAHAIVEEAPSTPTRATVVTGPHLLALSAASDESLVAGAAGLAAALEFDGAPDLDDVAHTLAVGRTSFGRRRGIVVTDTDDAVAQLRSLRPPRGAAVDRAVRTVFLFPGGGSQYVRMGAGLGARLDVFARTRREVAAVIRSVGGVDIEPLLADDVDPAVLDAPSVALPAVFATTLAMAAQWRSWGVEPDAMVGHSLGEYSAAHLAGVFSVEDAARLVVTRAGLVERMGGPDASMLVVPLGEEAARTHLGPEVSLAVVNGADEVVLAGRTAAIDAVAAALAAEAVESTRVRLAAAGHSVLLDPVLDEFREVARTIVFAPPVSPYISNLSGTWVTPEEATDPEYWVRHLRGTVRFAEGLATAMADGPAVTVEIGPGHALSATARRSVAPPVDAVASMRHARSDLDDTVAALDALGRAWAAGAVVDPDVVGPGTGRRIHLPTYAFTGDRHWIDPALPTAATNVGASSSNVGEAPPRIDDTAEMWWERTWSPSPAPPAAPPGRWWILADEGDPRSAALAGELGGLGHDVGGELRSGAALDLRDGDSVVLFGPAAPAGDDAASELGAARQRWLADAPALVASLGSGATGGHRLVLVTEGATALDGPASHPAEALVRGVGSVAPREYPDLVVRVVDVESATADTLAREIAASTMDPWVVLAGGQRMVPALAAAEPRRLLGERIPAGSAVLVTGGLGGVGSVLAEHLAERGVQLAVVTGSALPPAEEWDQWRATHGPRDRTSVRLDRIERMRRSGAHVEVVVGDVSTRDGVAQVVADAVGRLGPLDAVVHAAGVLRDAPLAALGLADVDAVLGAKTIGALALIADAQARSIPLVCLVSSTSTEIGAAGQASYVAASAVLDEVAGRHGEVEVVTFGSGMWSGVGMADEFARRSRLGLGSGVPVTHPVFEEIVRDDRRGTVDVVGHLDASRHWQVGDHRDAAGDPVLPGTGHLWLLVDAVRTESGADEPVALHDVLLHEPLVVPDGAVVLVRVRIEVDGGVRRASLESDRGALGWVRHTSAEIVDPAGDGISVGPGPSGPRTTADPFEGQRDHLVLGDRWPRAVAATIGSSGVVAEIDATASTPASSIDVAALDAATGLAVQILRQGRSDGRLWVPIGYRSVHWTGPTGGAIDARVSRAEPGTSLFDLALCDGSGRPRVAIEGLELWAVDPLRLGAAHDARGVAPSHAEDRGSLAALADGGGITAAEGGRLFDALLADGRPRLVASTVDLPWLIEQAGDVVDELPRPAPDAQVLGETTLDTLAMAWTALLGVDPVEADDDFFDLGGHSLIAIRLLARITRAFGVELQLAELLDASTLGEMASLVDSHLAGSVDPSRRSLLVEFGGDGQGRPLHVVHGAGGGVMFLWALSRALAGDRRIIGIQAKGADGKAAPDDSIEAMVERYVSAMLAEGPGPYLLAGYSGGGLVALEMAEALRARGERVLSVMLFDSAPPGRAEPRRRRRVLNVGGHLAAGRWAGVAPYLRDLAANGFRRPPVEPPDEEVGHLDLFDHFSEVAERHQLGTYGGRIDLFKADRVWPIQPWDYYWTPHVAGELHIVSVPGDHFSMFSPDLVGELADAVRHLASIVDPFAAGPGST